MALHEIPMERRTLHGHYSRELEPVLEIDPGDTIALATLDAGWGLEAPHADGSQRERFEPLDPELDSGHALIGPVAVRSARAGQMLEVGIDAVRVGPFGFTVAGGWPSFMNDGSTWPTASRSCWPGSSMPTPASAATAPAARSP